MGKDKTFKEHFSIKGYDIATQIEFGKYYTPDKIFINSDDHVVVCEHSSTGDRKAHIGELMQFLAFVSENAYKEYTLLIFLDGASESRPDEESERDRLQFYYSKYKSVAIRSAIEKIQSIAIIDYTSNLPPDIHELLKASKKIEL